MPTIAQPRPRPAETLERLLAELRGTRAQTLRLVAGLSAEDLNIQSMPDCSPGKWHLAHTSWFFETFILAVFDPAYRPFDDRFRALFNSYYDSVGPQQPRPQRAQPRPAYDQVLAYRAFVDERLPALLSRLEEKVLGEALALLELGIHHEQQHQELLLTDLKHAFYSSPLRPSWPFLQQFLERSVEQPVRSEPMPVRFLPRAEGLVWIGAEAGTEHWGFAFDNERPRHRVFLEAHALASHVVTNAEYVEFIEAGGYRRPELWLSEGFRLAAAEAWQAPLYWERRDGRWFSFTGAGDVPVERDAPVTHVSYFEADAYARWAGARLPTEAEWEAATSDPSAPATLSWGAAWEWTQSAYLPYPRYRAPAGAVGEYNAKFMVNQMVLRGGSVFSPKGHLRPTYRNYFPPSARWQVSGVRLARDQA